MYQNENKSIAMSMSAPKNYGCKYGIDGTGE